MLCKWSCLVILFFAQNIFPERLAFSPTMIEDCSIYRIKLVLLRWRILEQPKPAIRLHCIKVLVLKVCDILNSYPLTESCVLQTANLHFAFSMFSMQNIYEVELYIIYFVKCLMCACLSFMAFHFVNHSTDPTMFWGQILKFGFQSNTMETERGFW